jgi:hypothetical protein
MSALFVRELQPQQYEPAHTAHRIVAWFAASPRLGLMVMLIAMPLGVLVLGSLTLRRSWSNDPELQSAARQTFITFRRYIATVLVAAATLSAGVVLAIVSLHILTD